MDVSTEARRPARGRTALLVMVVMALLGAARWT